MKFRNRFELKRATIWAFLILMPLCGGQAYSAPLGPLIWNTIAVGEYKVKVPDTNLCVARKPGSWVGQEAFLALETCGDFYPQTFGFVPTAFENGIVKFRIKNRNHCATVARGVVFGAPSIDVRPCDLNNQSQSDFNAAPDQRFTIEKSGSSIIIRTLNNKCMTVQGGNFTIGTQIIEDTCNSSRSQQFSLQTDRSGLHIEDINAMRGFGWKKVDGASGLPNARAYYREMPNMNLPAADYNWFATDNDNGSKCAQKCSIDINCKGFTWVNPAARNGQAMCYLKNAINAPTIDNFTVSGQLRD